MSRWLEDYAWRERWVFIRAQKEREERVPVIAALILALLLVGYAVTGQLYALYKKETSPFASQRCDRTVSIANIAERNSYGDHFRAYCAQRGRRS